MKCQSLLSQALAWLDNMHIPYKDDCPPDFWSFEYKGLDIHLPKNCETRDLGENMKLLSKSICGWWKPMILFDCKAKTATLFINPEDLTLQNVENKDIDWNSMCGLDNDCIERVKSRSAFYPTNIRGFRHGTAEVEWQLNPDGRFYMDDDGFGLTDDEEVSLIGRIDREGKVVKSFTLK